MSEKQSRFVSAAYADRLEAERDKLLVALKCMVDSAVPNRVEQPDMWKAWKLAREVIAVVESSPERMNELRTATISDQASWLRKLDDISETELRRRDREADGRWSDATKSKKVGGRGA